MVSLTYASGEIRCPLTTQILKESCHQVQRCGLFHSYILKLSHSAVLQTRCVSQCHSLSVCLWRCHPNRKFEERKISYPFFPLGSKTEPAALLSQGEEVDPPSFCSIFPVLSPSHSHLPAGERPLMEGCFYEAGGFVLSVVQRSHATVDVPNQPPLLCSASSTIPGTSSSMALLIQSACRELWVHRLAGTLVLCRGAGLAPVLYSLPADMPPKQVIQVCDVRKSLRIETLFPMSYHQHEGN